MKKFKVIIGVVLIFLAGSLAGSMGASLVFKKRMGEYLSGERFPGMRVLRKLSTDLNLSDSQKTDIEKILIRSHAELNELRKKHLPEAEKILNTAMGQMKEKLDDAQKGRLDEIYQRFLTRFQKGQDHRGAFRKGPPRIEPSEIIHRLHLSDDQREKVIPILEDRLERQKELYEAYRNQKFNLLQEFKKESQAHDASVRSRLIPLLTPEQMEEYQRIQDDPPRPFMEAPDPEQDPDPRSR